LARYARPCAGHPRLNFLGGAKIPGAREPGETMEIGFPAAGSFLVFCGIHPKMEPYVEVAR
jgi:plastocyanin